MEFIVNEFLTLRLEEGFDEFLLEKLETEITMIYVAEEPFMQCKFLLLEIPTQDMTSLDEMKSIDQVAQELDRSLEPSDEFTRVNKIPPETEFWGHCSNLQAWYENDYNTSLLHSNISFPLLKKLTEAGDLLARKVFKDEVARRYDTGVESVRKFLENGEYLRFLTKEEFYSLIDSDTEYDVVKYLERKFGVKRYEIDVRNGRIIKLDLGGHNLKELPKIITQFECLEDLNVASNYLDAFPDWIGKFKRLQLLRFNSNKSDKLATLPDSIGDLSSLEELVGFNNDLKWLPESIGKLSSLRRADLHNNKLERFPESIGNLSNLEELIIKSNKIKVIPETIGNLRSIKTLDLSKNDIKIIPESIGNLKNSLRILTLGDNNLNEVPSSIGNLSNLEILDISHNSIKSLPPSFRKLVLLREMFLDGNPLEKIPEYIYDLPKLTLFSVENTKINRSQKAERKFKEKGISVYF
ncbi:MAG: leucine-rich repeat domain-containing protein [Candidatus Helarchaeota archaeon]